MSLPRCFTALALASLACLTPACAQNPPTTTPASPIEARIDETLADGVAGAIVLIETGEDRQILARGLADRASGTPMPTDALLRLASVGKLYTAAIIHRLALDGQIDLDRTAADYVAPEHLTGIANAGTASLRQLLNHTAGVPDYYDEAWEAGVGTSPRNTAQATLDHIRGRPADFAPGEGYAYSNSHYQLLGLVAEAVTGEPLGRLMERLIVAPLGLTATGYDIEDDPRNTIHGYGRLGDDTVDTFTLRDNNGADGGVMASAAEAAVFLDALFAEDGVLRDIGDSMLSDRLDLGGGRYRALGPLYIEHESGLVLVTHNGFIDGYVTTVVRVLSPDITLVVHLNASQPQLAGTLARDLLLNLAQPDG